MRERVCVRGRKREREREGSHLAGNPDEEVDHSVCVGLLHRFGELRLCARHGGATSKRL